MPTMSDLHGRLASYRRQRDARGAVRDELQLLDDLANDLTRLETVAAINEEANNVRPALPTVRQGVEALRDELRAELKGLPPGSSVNPVEVIHRIAARLDGLL